MKKLYTLLPLVVLLASSASAAVLYSNGPLDGNTVGYTINFGFSVTDSFTTSGGVATSFTIGSWVGSGDTPTTVDWAIGTSSFGSEIASGTATFSNVFQFTNGSSYDVYLSTAGLPNVALAAGGYWFTLQNATTARSNPAYWDENRGPSTAIDSSLGPIPSETFEIDGTTSVTPEPASLGLLGGGILAFAGVLRRKFRA